MHISNWDMAQNFNLNFTIGFPDFENIDIDTKIVILSALVQTLSSNTSFLVKNKLSYLNTY